MCCKGHCKLAGENAPPLEAIAAYMSAECACPKEDYTGKLMEMILREALFDYMAARTSPDMSCASFFSNMPHVTPIFRSVSTPYSS
jgi:hypothetical protein